MEFMSVIGSHDSKALRARRGRRFRSGAALIYTTAIMVAMLAFASMAIDYGRAQLAKTELRRAADSAARYAAQGFANNSVSANAIAAAAQNNVDGTALVLQSGDITTITWNSASGTVVAGNPSPNAVQITARRTNARGTGLPLYFMRLFGMTTVDLTATSTASYSPAINVSIVVNSKGDPWLAGMPAGTTANTFDSAPANSPTLVSSGLPLGAGDKLNFSFSGSASHKPTAQSYDGDGDQSRNIWNYSGDEHGKSNIMAPIGSVVGVFLDNTQPNLAGLAPSSLDFSTVSSRDFSSLTPALRQTFFIGNGKREDETTLQDFIVPAGATRLYIGIMDGQQWSDNSGSFSTTVVQPMEITLVK